MQQSQQSAAITLTFGQSLGQVFVHELSLISERIKQTDGVQAVMTRLDLHQSQQVIIYVHEGVEPASLLRRIAAALRTPVAPTSTPASTESVISTAKEVSSTAPIAARFPCPLVTIQSTVKVQSSPSTERLGMRQWLAQTFYGGLAAISFGMAWVGLFVPGIPTVPFVILTAYLAAKSSPAFHRRLQQSRVLGSMIRDWEDHHGIRPEVKRNLLLVTAAIVGMTIAMAPASPELYLLVGSMCLISVMMIWLLPSIELSPAGS